MSSVVKTERCMAGLLEKGDVIVTLDKRYLYIDEMPKHITNRNGDFIALHVVRLGKSHEVTTMLLDARFDDEFEIITPKLFNN